MKKLTTAILASTVMGLSFSGSVSAHASLETPSAEVGSTYKGVMRIGHGCEGSATQVVRIELPLELRRVKPMPKPGWKLETVSKKLDTPFDYYGKTITEDVREIIWSGGNLEDGHYDEFVFRGKVAGEADQVLHLSTTQECVKGENSWTQIPAPGQDSHDLKRPAPQLKLVTSHEHKH
ncbi:YcnI family protein [Motiliproteus sp. MSK22-1]|uniref:YcnI family copper-binding membrane protein n=1 Tax=Motiliproteus sp. MSK22-1 TaxID=1897630 RepID=UPI0009762284|nr:YcnI family protein [Motiliproteus sp. MSK22-1]OMH31745.1 hypothetical protein BGP75_16620 [Motiliproteus sp. MSK22-1]